MLICLLLDAIIEIFKIIPDLNVPSLGEEFNVIIDTYFSYIESGLAIAGAYFPLYYFSILFEILIGIDIVVALYHFILWVLNKIPWIDID